MLLLTYLAAKKMATEMIRGGFVALVLLLISASADAGTAITFTPAGLKSCSDWNNASAANKNIALAWVWGALSGMVLESSHDFLRPTTPEVIHAQVNEACRLKPNASLADIAIDISRTLGD